MARIGIAGLGLIGASVGLALARAGHAVSGLEPHPGRREEALARGAARHAASTAAELAGRCEILFLCAPPRANLDLLRGLAAAPGAPQLLITDTGSVKGPIAELGQELFPPGSASRFVPGHPMAGGEGRGPLAARVDLFEGATWYLCPPLPGSVPAQLLGCLTQMGATPQEVTPAEHDRRMALLSHLPQMLAFATAAAWRASGVQAGEGGPVARELARLSQSPPELWAEVAFENRAQLARALRELGAEAGRLADVLARGDLEEARRALLELAP